MNPSHYKVKMLSIKESSVKCLLDQSYLGGSKNAGLLNFQVSENWERGLCSITDRAHVFSPQHASLRPINSNKGITLNTKKELGLGYQHIKCQIKNNLNMSTKRAKHQVIAIVLCLKTIAAQKFKLKITQPCTMCLAQTTDQLLSQ